MGKYDMVSRIASLSDPSYPINGTATSDTNGIHGSAYFNTTDSASTTYRISAVRVISLPGKCVRILSSTFIILAVQYWASNLFAVSSMGSGS